MCQGIRKRTRNQIKAEIRKSSPDYVYRMRQGDLYHTMTRQAFRSEDGRYVGI